MRFTIVNRYLMIIIGCHIARVFDYLAHSSLLLAFPLVDYATVDWYFAMNNTIALSLLSLGYVCSLMEAFMSVERCLTVVRSYKRNTIKSNKLHNPMIASIFAVALILILLSYPLYLVLTTTHEGFFQELTGVGIEIVDISYILLKVAPLCLNLLANIVLIVYLIQATYECSWGCRKIVESSSNGCQRACRSCFHIRGHYHQFTVRYLCHLPKHLPSHQSFLC